MSVYGECVVTRTDDPATGKTTIRIERADPVIRIAPSVLASLPRPPSDFPATYDGKVMRINGINQTVIYRIRDVLEETPGLPGWWDYIGEWPDL